jgi:uncharacterized membrane protein YeaQ/YmgE (transglycosylase-associated protein family)
LICKRSCRWRSAVIVTKENPSQYIPNAITCHLIQESLRTGFPLERYAGSDSFQTTKENAMGLLWWIIVGMVAGWATGKIMRGSGYGFIADTVLGIIGAVVGGYVAGFLGISPVGGLLYTILIAIVGAVIVVFLFRLIAGRR